MNSKKYDIHGRLIDFSTEIISFVNKIKNFEPTPISNKLLRSGTSPSVNYSEARNAMSKNVFLDKMKVCLKELEESHSCLKATRRKKNYRSNEKVQELIHESRELISMLVKRIEAASKN